jgi:hypothetical protein
MPAPYLDELVVSGAVERLAMYITTLQPLVELLELEHGKGVEVEMGKMAR